jgi:hypothetical protein
VLPIEQVSQNEYKIPFELPFTFKPDSLVNLIDQLMSSNKLSSNYIVQVVEEQSNKVMFGYAILGSKQSNIIPCNGRKQPSLQYGIHIQFQDSNTIPSKKLYIAGVGFLMIGLFLFGMQMRKRPLPLATTVEHHDEELPHEKVSIGQYVFNMEEQSLMFHDQRIALSTKESKILRILALSQNQVVDRNRLQKEVWEDEGVIVGRSLDMFISKLRKKLELDAAVKIITIHGKGYKLEVS